MRAPPLAALLLCLLITACATPVPKSSGGTSAKPPASKGVKPPRGQGISPEPYAQAFDAGPEDHEIPPDLDKIPDAVPRKEPLSRSGNAPVYEVLGRSYNVLPSASGFSERGRASWYGKKFQGRTTASGERYDMFKMTAAHKTLPLPSYVRVTNTDNGRSVVVKVNDRGPFHAGRIIDLSYTAAAKLDIIKHGHAEVLIEAVEPGDEIVPPSAPAAAAAVPAQGWLQVGVYFDPINAIALREELLERRFLNVQVVAGVEDGDTVHRVVVGPFAGSGAAETTRQRLRAGGYEASWTVR